MSPPTSKYLDPAELQRLRHVVFASRRPVEGLYAGRHVSRQRGHSVEFTDYRQYFPGDEIADIDWKVFGRSDRLVIKRFEHQSDMNVHLLLDASASMAYPRNSGDGPLGDERSKFHVGAQLAAAIAFLVLKQQDKVSFSLAQQGLLGFTQPRSALPHLDAILQILESATPDHLADLPGALGKLIAQVGRRGVVIVISDLLDDRDETLKQLNAILARGLEVIVFHLLHPDELELPPGDSAVFTDAETGERLTLHINDIREEYTRRMRDFLDGWSTALRGRGIDYNLVITNQPYNLALEKYLFLRASLR